MSRHLIVSLSTIAAPFALAGCVSNDLADAPLPIESVVSDDDEGLADQALTELEADDPAADEQPPAPPALLVSPTARWRHLVQPGLDSGDDCRAPAGGAAWRTATAFDDSFAAGWAEGPAGLGDDDECVTQYLRHALEVPDPALHDSLTVRLPRDDGAAVYLNGTRVPASRDEDRALVLSGIADLLVPGTNLVAVELHRRADADPDGIELMLTHDAP